MGLISFWKSLWKNDVVVEKSKCNDCDCEPDTCKEEVPTVEVVETKEEVPTVEVVETKKEEEVIGERLAEKVTAKEIKAKRKPVKKEVAPVDAVEKKASKPRRRRKPKAKPDTDSEQA